jgi:hypothetical protein
MPGLKGAKNVGRNIREVHKGKTYKRTRAKFGKKKADKQAVAIAMSEAGVSRKKKKAKKKKSKSRNRGETEQ